MTMSEDMNPILGEKLIVCLLPHGKGLDLVERLHQEKDLVSANVTSGRGLSAAPGTPIGSWTEADVLKVVVPAERADEIFAFLYDAGAIGVPHGGLMFQHSLLMATAFELPDIEEADTP